MPAAVSVQFEQAGQMKQFAVGENSDLGFGDFVVVDDDGVREVAQVVRPAAETQSGKSLDSVVRKATPWDFLERDNLDAMQEEVLDYCHELVRDRKLSLKIVKCRYDLEGGLLTVSYSSTSRAKMHNQMRDLARTLAQELGVRIDMQYIQDRQAAKLLDGVGKCGRQLCCTTWLREFPNVKLRMAKTQQISLNPDEISGVCGRLLCCLSYEDDMYRDLTRSLPKVGARVVTPQGEGRVRYIYPLKNTVTVSLEDGVMADFDADELMAPAGGGQACGGCSHTRRAEGAAEAAEAAAARQAPACATH